MEIADSFWSEWEKWKSNSNVQQNYDSCQNTIFEILNFNIIIFHLKCGDTTLSRTISMKLFPW